MIIRKDTVERLLHILYVGMSFPVVRSKNGGNPEHIRSLLVAAAIDFYSLPIPSIGHVVLFRHFD